jgi:nitric oxide reductase activation protein
VPGSVGRSGSSGSPAVDPQFRLPKQNEPTAEEQRRAREQQKERNKERQAALKKDTDKLLALATELKEYVDKTNENVLSVDVMRKAEEIEKLAHSVKQKMKE